MARINPQSFAAVIAEFLASAKFKSLAPATQEYTSRYLRQAQHPETLGAYPAAVMRPALVQGFLDGYADRPGSQMAARSALRFVEKWALVRDKLAHPITTGTEVIGSDGGHIPWTDFQVATAEHYARPDISRLVTLAANTGQRGSDLYRTHPHHLETVDGRPGINVMRKKNGDTVPIWIPFTPALIAVMATWKRTAGPFLLHKSGRPWKKSAEMTNEWTRERDRNLDLGPCTGLVLHGLRGTAIVRLRRAGCTTLQISDMIGLSDQMVERYCRFSDQRMNASAGMAQMEERGQNKNVIKLQKRGE